MQQQAGLPLVAADFAKDALNFGLMEVRLADHLMLVMHWSALDAAFHVAVASSTHDRQMCVSYEDHTGAYRSIN